MQSWPPIQRHGEASPLTGRIPDNISKLSAPFSAKRLPRLLGRHLMSPCAPAHPQHPTSAAVFVLLDRSGAVEVPSSGRARSVGNATGARNCESAPGEAHRLSQGRRAREVPARGWRYAGRDSGEGSVLPRILDASGAGRGCNDHSRNVSLARVCAPVIPKKANRAQPIPGSSADFRPVRGTAPIQGCNSNYRASRCCLALGSYDRTYEQAVPRVTSARTARIAGGLGANHRNNSSRAVVCPREEPWWHVRGGEAGWPRSTTHARNCLLGRRAG